MDDPAGRNAKKMTDDEVRHIVADMLATTGHGNPLFVRDVREGRQDDGPYMRAALAVRDRVTENYQFVLKPPAEEFDG